MTREQLEPRSEWTPMAEAISFISATLGETYTAAQGTGLYWSALGVMRPDGVRPYPVELKNLGSEIKIALAFSDIGDDHATEAKLYAILGWATYHGHECDHD